jgi:pimeloyl-ACP methyl ester carboxylesterase
MTFPDTAPPTASGVHVEQSIGRYMQLEIDGRPHRVYWEEAGPADGIPLLCLHTAGSDGRQFRGLLADPDVTDRFRVIVHDMPWHGKSSPPAGYRDEEYRLTTEGYMNQVIAVADALQLDQPVVMGCSIGGRIVLHLALDHPERFRAVIGLQSAAHTAPYYDISWLDRPDVNGWETCAAYISGLFSPDAPPADRWETLWHYMQGGPGVFKGDLFFHTIDGDIRDRLGGIDTAKTPVYMLTGDYDYSGSPADSEEVARRIEGSDYKVMPGLGHFPMSENYPRFRQHLLPVLAKIAD